MNATSGLTQTLLLLSPELWVVLAASVMMTACAFIPRSRGFWAAWAVVIQCAAIAMLFVASTVETDPYATTVVNDPLAFLARLGLLASGLLLTALCHDQMDDAQGGEFFGLLLVLVAGAMVVASANDLIVLFLGLELVSIPTYFLLFLTRKDDGGREAATKYFFLSIFSSAIFLFGVAYLYGMTGTTNLRAMAWLLQVTPDLDGQGRETLGVVALVFLLGGLSFRAAAVPFHFYAPDVYQGTSTAMAALLAWVPKVIGFLAILRALTCVVGGDGTFARDALVLAWVIAAATMTLGNTLALLQDNIKRLLAYSSIAHAGYLMMGVTAAFANGVGVGVGAARLDREILGAQGILIYLAAYGFMTLGTFAAVMCLRRPDSPSNPGREVEAVDDLAGLARSRPLMSVGLAICLLSLAGIPLTFGFWGKFYVFASVVALAGSSVHGTAFLTLAVVGAINAAIGAYYYLRLIVIMYFREPSTARVATDSTVPAPLPWPAAAVLGVCALGSVFLGCVPTWVANGAQSAAVAAATLPDPLPNVTASR